MQALVTGAGRGIGRGVALELARRGIDVVATMRDVSAGESLVDEAKAEGVGGELTIRRLDVTDPTSIVIPEGLQILVNNAGVDCANHSVEDTPADVWRQVFETNVFGLVEVTRRALPVLRAAGGGVVCNVTSAAAVVPMPFFAAYRASKAAVAAFGESLRAEVANHGIRVLEVLPGPVDTDMLAGSAHTPEAIASPAYAALASRVGEVRAALDDRGVPVREAAVAIVDAIEDGTSPLRVACDPVGAGLLEAWRSSSDEEFAAGFLAAFDID